MAQIGVWLIGTQGGLAFTVVLGARAGVLSHAGVAGDDSARASLRSPATLEVRTRAALPTPGRSRRLATGIVNHELDTLHHLVSSRVP